jgi:hypothetical protein
MNETTEIPAILRGKPQGTKLHDLVRGTDVFLKNLNCTEKKEREEYYQKHGRAILLYNRQP